jgi:hypothetical protein
MYKHRKSIFFDKKWQKERGKRFSLENNPRWKGGRSIHSSGYIVIRVGYANYRFEHRLVMEQHLGRKLKRRENVHHINGDKKDNRLENLELLDVSEHTRRHWREGIFTYPDGRKKYRTDTVLLPS